MRPLGYLLTASSTHQLNVNTHPTVTSRILVYHDRPVDDGVLPKEAEIGVNEAVVPLVHALQTAVLAAEVANLILIITAHTRRGADRCINIEGVQRRLMYLVPFVWTSVYYFPFLRLYQRGPKSRNSLTVQYCGYQAIIL